MIKKKLLTISSILLTLSLSACASSSSPDDDNGTKPFSGKTLTIYNCDDYISSGDEDYRDLIEEFEEMTGCSVKYYTYDTNETMYNQFTLAKQGTYDLICTSDYMIQKMVKEDLIEPFNSIKDEVPNYDEYASSYLRNKLKNMTITKDSSTVNLDQYAVGYMWGTLGLLYDSQYTDTIQEDIKSWNILWDETYKNVISLKNSMRDTFVVGLMHYYANQDEEFQSAMEKYLKDDATESDIESYNNLVQQIFDFKLDGSESSDKENNGKIQIVKDELISVKDNIFGFEVDSGKNDIVTGKIKINLAWSGDACYSIETAWEERDDLELEYYVPDDGGNLWFDGWTLPKGGQTELACAFLDYLSDPKNAAVNMDYVGYTPFIVGDDIFDLTSSWYGASDYSSLHEYIYDEDEETQDLCIYNNILYKCIQSTEAGTLPTNEDYFESCEYSSTETYYEGDMLSYMGKLYYCINDNENGISGVSISEEESFEEVEAYDLSYLFDGTIEATKKSVIYPSYGYFNKLSCQYPDLKTTKRCGIMNDFGTYNDAVIIMWGQVRAYTNMTPFYVFFFICLALSITSITYVLVSKNLSTRKKRNIAKMDK